ncbi:MAG: hypothetical protein Q8R34_00635 [bacterium]|nr:hypothetical protein [bacterium]
MRFFRLSLFLVLALSACGPRPSEPNEYQQNGFYSHPQALKTPVTLLVQERNGEPFYTASAFLIEKERGIFSTAKHFVEHLGTEEFKIFCNGKVYQGLVMVTASTSDLAIVGIKDKFNPADLPEPSILAESSPGAGALVRVQGIHPHPPHLQIDKILVEIMRGYYGMSWKKNEFVFDDLEAKVSNPDKEVKNKDIEGTPEGFGLISNTYIEIITAEDHRWSFGGLSGGPVVDGNNEVVGIVAHGEEGGDVLIGLVIVYQPWKVLRIVPIEELHKLIRD